MTNEKLSYILRGIDLKKCKPIVENHIYYISKLIKQKISNGYGEERICKDLYEFLVIAPGGIKKGIILRCDNIDLHWYVYKKHRGEKVLSNALRTGVLRKVWPKNKTITCCYEWKDNKKDKYEMTKHLAEIAGLKIKE